jgi:hypothetical protein
MGEISYRKIEETKHAIRHTFALPPLVTSITRDSSRYEDYVKIIEGEKDLEKRYLRILYRLNPFLPFRFNKKEYKNIDELLDDACTAAASFWSLFEVYKLEHIHIWVKEGSPTSSQKLTADTGLNDFLTFLYRMNNKYPFFVKNHKFENPELLIAEIKTSNKLWANIAGAMSKGNIQAWFAETGKTCWNNSMEKGNTAVQKSALYSNDEFWKASVQVLINVVTQETPLIEPGTSAISLVDIEAGSPLSEIIELNLTKGEFVKAGVTIKNLPPGFTADATTLAFDRLEQITQNQLNITIDPTQLIRNQDYKPIIIIQTLYQTIEIPLFIRVVFPKRAVLFQLGKYAVIFSIFLGLARFILAQMISYKSSLSLESYIPFNSPPADLPFDAFGILVPFVFLVAGFYYSRKIIEKLEGL